MDKQWREAAVKPLVVGIAIALASALARAQEPIATEAEVQFDVWEYRVLGNTTLPNASIERVLYGLTGSSKALSDVEAARQALEQAYRDAGFGTVFVDIPEQNTDEGIVRLRVTEGRLDRVRITGARYFSNGELRAALPALTSGDVPHLPQVQSQLAAFNRLTPDRAVVPVLKAGRTPGTVDVELKVSDELPLHGSLEINDRYTADTTRWRLNASLSYDNLFQRQQSLALQYQVSPEKTDELEALIVSYVFRVPTWQSTFAFYAVDSNTDVAALGTLSVLGKGKIFGMRAIRALPEQKDYFHSVTFGLDYKDFEDQILLDANTGLQSPISYLNWSLNYNGTLRGARSTSGFNLGANFGVRAAGNDEAEFAGKRAQGDPNYFYLRGSVQHTHDLPLRLQLFGKLAGQLTHDPLVSNEQYAIGGVDTVRGYLEATRLGDYGASGTVELRNTLLAKWFKRPANTLYFYAFYDAGIVTVLHPLPSQTARFDLSSAGLGVRGSALYGFEFAIDWAHAFDAAGTVAAGDDRAHLSLKYAF